MKEPTAAHPLRVLIALPYPVQRAGIHSMMEAHPELLVVGEVGQASELLEQHRLLQPDLLFFDDHLAGLTPALLTSLACDYPELALLGLIRGAPDDMEMPWRLVPRARYLSMRTLTEERLVQHLLAGRR